MDKELIKELIKEQIKIKKMLIGTLGVGVCQTAYKRNKESDRLKQEKLIQEIKVLEKQLRDLTEGE